MPFRSTYEELEEQTLASYAVFSSRSLGRKHPEKEHDLRTAFQRDRDRVIHSTAFRRLQYKTQVFVNHEGDYYRTRLTHTIETAQIARTTARVLKLNEDLVEAIALAHDLGHGPFGHAGEWALQEMMEGYGGFEHNVQGLRIIEYLENSYPEFQGLNLTFETSQGIQKHPERFKKKKESRFRSLEADLVDLIDEVAYTSHDLDDGLRAGLLNEDMMSEVKLWQESMLYISRKYPKISNLHCKRLAIRLIINKFVQDIIKTTQSRVQKYGIKSLEDLQKNSRHIVAFSPEIKKAHAELKRFLMKNLYQHPHVVSMTEKGQRIIKALFQHYHEHPGVLPLELKPRIKKDGLRRAICDYVAGMTDRSAINEYQNHLEVIGTSHPRMRTS